MSVTKYLPLALIAGGVVVLWRLNKGIQAALPAAPPPGPVNGLGFGFKSVTHAISQATQQVQSIAKVATAPVVAPLKIAAAIPLSAKVAIQSGSFSAGIQSINSQAKNAVKVGTYRPNSSIMLGRSRPVTRSGQPATTAAAVVTDVQWTPVAGQSGWSTAPGEGGTTVFKGPSGEMFSATPGDISSLGGLSAVIDYYKGVNSQSSVETSGSSVPMPPQNWGQPAGGGPNDTYQGPVPSGSGSSSYAPDPSSLIPQQSTYTDPGANTAAAAAATDPSAVTQQVVDPTVDPAPASSTLHPLIAVGALVAVPAMLFLGGKH